MAINRRTSAFVPVTCLCGRSLRAKLEQVGTEIRCWDCQRMMPVPMPREPMRAVQELTNGFVEVLRGPTLSWVMAGALAVSLALSVPWVGIALGGVLLVLGAGAYGRLIRRTSDFAVVAGPRWWSALVPGSIVGGLLGAGLVPGLIVPLWVQHAGPRQSPRMDRAGLAVFVLSLVIVPTGMLLACAIGRVGRLSLREYARLMVRYPWALLATLGLVPASLVLLEVGLAAIFYWQGILPFFTLEFMPIPNGMIMYEGTPYFDTIDFRSLPSEQYLARYVRSIRQGYSILGAIPPSLSLPTRAGLSASCLYLPDVLYTLARFLMTFGIVAWIMTAFAIQARWLGLIAALEKGRPAVIEPPAGLPE